VKGQWPLSVGRLSGQGVEQSGHGEALFSGLHPHLSFLDHVHELNPNECVLGCLERFKRDVVINRNDLQLMTKPRCGLDRSAAASAVFQ